MHASIRICPDHILYNNAWISKQFGTVVALEEKCHLKFLLYRLKVEVKGSNEGQNDQKYVLSLSGAYLVHLFMDFKIILHSSCRRGGEMPFETCFQVG